jgi:ribosomal protein S21
MAMPKHKAPPFKRPRHCRDDTTTTVGPSFEQALRQFATKVKHSGMYAELKFRRDNPSMGARKRAKKKKALQRLRKKDGSKTRQGQS